MGSVDDVIDLHVDGLRELCPEVAVSNRRGGAHLPSTPPRDRLTLHVPYCCRTLKWHVIYSAESPLRAPEFILGDNEDGPEVADGESAVSREAAQGLRELREWNSQDPLALAHAVRAVLAMLRERHARSLVGSPDDRVRRLAEHAAPLPPGEAQLLVDGAGSAHVMLALPPDPRDPDDMDVDSSAAAGERSMVHVTFDAAGTPKAEVVLGPRTAAAMAAAGGGPQTPRSLALGTGPALVAELLAKAAELARAPLASLRARQRLFRALLKAYGTPVEYDMPQCTKICFAIEEVPEKVPPALLIVQAGEGFPAEAPVLTLQSAMWFHAGHRPMQVVYRGYPFSPRWTQEELAVRIA
eukprot:m51a1_g12372 putative brca1-a complex subunit bre (354) ;mRNA; r:605054-606193